MDEHVLKKLRAVDALQRLSDGSEGVRVSLQSMAPNTAGSRTERYATLRKEFAKLADVFKSQGLFVDLASISTSAQTVDAVVQLQMYENVKQKLERAGIRVDLLIDREVV